MKRHELGHENGSQLGDGNFFRNCIVNGKHFPLSSEYFSRIYFQSLSTSNIPKSKHPSNNSNSDINRNKVNGALMSACKVEFDFVSIVHPASFAAQTASILKGQPFIMTKKLCSFAKNLNFIIELQKHFCIVLFFKYLYFKNNKRI